MPGPSAGVVALIAPLVVSLAGATLPLAAVACAALSVPALLSRVPFWPPQPRPTIVAAAIAAVENRIRMGLSCAGDFRITPIRAQSMCRRPQPSRTRQLPVSYQFIAYRHQQMRL